ncbi:MAG: tRNA pseudouridine(38-40) synthase TruA [Chloroflexota bacterium]|nr:tRNA pseudouridine(38-40) synthase TruA [Chloroflexota bacterium]
MPTTGRALSQKLAREGGPARYRARVEYDGTDFAGFQVQPGSRTVQGELEAALGRVSGNARMRVEAAGRTDAGVHATGQVIAFTYAGRLSAAELARALDALLPSDVALHGLRQVDEAFRPRYAARYRAYRYTIWNGPRSPLHERYALGVRVPLDSRAMASAAQVLVGRHDFSAFGGGARQPVRTLHRVGVRREGSMITIDVTGDAFTRQMVRSIVAALLRVGRGEATAAELAAALRGPERAFSGALAPPHGLCLRRVVMGRTTRTDTES